MSMGFRMVPRRGWMASLLIAGWMMGSAALVAAQESKVLNIYNWSDYIAEDTIRNFEKETGIKVRYDTFDNNEIVHAKLVAGKSGYDIVVPSSNWAKLQLDGGLLRKLDKSQLPNLRNLDPAIQQQIANLDPGNEYLVNWLWGYTTVGINTAKVKAALGGEPMPANAWELVFNPKYVSKLKSCGVSVLDSASGAAVGGALAAARGAGAPSGWRPIATLDLRIDYMKPATPGRDLMARAQCYKLTRNVAFVRGVAYHDDPEDPIATSTATFMLSAPDREPREG